MPNINLGLHTKREITVNKRSYQGIYQDKRWKALRFKKMKDNPLCEECEKKGKVVQTEEVHHIIPFQVGVNDFEVEELAFNYNNLISLCVECHKEAHQKLKKVYRLPVLFK